MTADGATNTVLAQASQSVQSFNIPSKPLLSALADFTAATGIQVVRPNAERISGNSGAVIGQYPPEAALRGILAGSGLIYQFTGPRTVSVHRAGEPATTFAPVEGQVQLEPIIVQGQGEAVPLGGDFSQIAITSEDLERKNPSDIKQVFRGESGVAVGGSTPMSQKVYVHGVEETNLAVTVDGSRQNNKVFHHNGTNYIDPGILKAVQVDAGVAPADAGPGALAGSIRYETKDARDLLAPGDNFGGFITGQYDTAGDTATTSLSAYGRSEGFEILGYGKFAKGDDYDDGDGNEVPGTSTDFIGGLGKIAYEAESGDRFELSHEQINDDADRPFRANMVFAPPPRPWNPAVRRYVIDRQNTVFSYTDETPEGWWAPKIVLAYSRTDVDVDQFVVGAPSPVYDYTSHGSTDSLNGKFENKFALAFGSVTAGFDFYSDEAKYVDAAYTVSEKADNIGIYSQARLEPWERTRLSFGFRGDQQWFEGLDGSKFDDAGLSGNISGEYDLTSFLTAKVGASHVWAGVPLSENYVMNPLWDYGDGPEPVAADNVVAGLIARHEGFTLEGGVFRTNIDNARVTLFNPAATAALRAFDLETKGFEVGAGYDWNDGFVRVKYANTDAEIDGIVADTYLGNYLTAPVGEIITVQWAHTFAGWGVTVGGDVEIALDYNEFNGILISGDPTENIPGYEVVNLFAQYVPASLPDLTLRAEVNNLFDETYTARGTYGSEYPGVITLREPGRSFVFSAKMQF
ncbi:TonB-dependent receptor [Flaviflagellibacter deserti]|uniref:TonB-dependent receptor n=1 Tax=Flaviflagellibacter deserti TaxID=2267266 RepID=A0ABV9YYE3_9HYPH